MVAYSILHAAKLGERGCRGAPAGLRVRELEHLTHVEGVGHLDQWRAKELTRILSSLFNAKLLLLPSLQQGVFHHLLVRSVRKRLRARRAFPVEVA